MESCNYSVIVEEYLITKSMRKISRDLNINRHKVRKILLENGIRILSNDEAIQNANLKHMKSVFNGNEKDKAYLYGFVLGDVHVFKKSKFTLRAITHTTHKSFVELFTNEFKKYGYVNCKYKENRKEWGVMVDLDYGSFKFLEQRKGGELPDWINDNNFLEFISGLIDSDGTVMIRKAGNYFQYLIRFFGEDKEVLEQIYTKLKMLGFRPSFYRNFEAGRIRMWKDKIMRYNKDYYILEICRKEETIKLLRALSLKHKEKIARKELLLKIYNKNLTSWNSIKQEVLALRKQLEAESTLAMN